MKKPPNKKLSLIPSVHRIAELLPADDLSREILIRIIRKEIADFKSRIHQFRIQKKQDAEEELIKAVGRRLEALKRPSLRRVINATGIILHTGLGRAPFAESARRGLQDVVENYSNIELDLESGERGERIRHVEELICLLTGAEAAAIVNNNAAAVLLLLNTLAFQKEVIVSRGELVEIGGSFRIPEVMEKSGALMREVGTTNKTHLRDYEKAVSKKAGLLLAVHTSNYRILGFTHAVGLQELSELGKRKKLPVAFDLGGGAVIDLEKFGLPHEPVVAECLMAGADIVTFSADKILGGCQAGILVGKKKYIDAVRANSLMRALRCDKMTYAVLEATLKLYLQPDALTFKLPALKMMTENIETVRVRAAKLMLACSGIADLKMTFRDSFAEAGSGTLPLEKIPSGRVSLRSGRLSAKELAFRMRKLTIPVIGYVKDQSFHLDMRTVRDDEVTVIAEAIKKIMNE